ncbi:glycosyltransferase [Algihabitans albus]|uniref:glycosyltransferase n=1 Tax=Algihabitans albus TaxID=2164067 RepID=UPI000E5D7CC3|nr:glycosyltransferase [Algihabitans albus]
MSESTALPLPHMTPHFILTRFNVLRVKQTQADAPGLDWLTHRFDLFERFCLPSVLNQNETNFRWLIYFDEKTPDQFQERVRSYSDRRILPIFVPPGGATLDKVKAHIRSELAEQTPWLLTTRLDNDDAIARDFCSRLRGSVTSLEPQALNFSNGVIYADGRVFRHSDRSNAFISALERTSNFETAWHGFHTEVSKFLPVKQIDSPPMWIQVVHDRNISNIVRGRLLSDAEGLDRFAVKLAQTKSPSKAALFLDRMMLANYRQLRDRLIRAAKAITSVGR